jgi:hypothetical protein
VPPRQPTEIISAISNLRYPPIEDVAMGKLGRKKRGRNRGYFYRNSRGWYANDGKRMVPLLFADGSLIKDKEAPGEEIEAAYQRWKKARQTAEKAGADVAKHGNVTVKTSVGSISLRPAATAPRRLSSAGRIPSSTSATGYRAGFVPRTENRSP